MEQQQQVPGVTPAAVVNVQSTAAGEARSSDKPRYWLITGVAFALTGAVLTFALKDSGASVLGVKLDALGGVLFAAGVLLMAAAGIESLGASESGLNADGIKSVGGLIAVVTGIVAVTTLTLVVTQVGGLEKESVVAVTSSAFGIISTVIGAYLGIKISSEASAKTNETLTSVALDQQQKKSGQTTSNGGSGA
ncbi:MAG: hypothetical protein ACLGG5_09500 [Thermoleophilia bacterium]